MADTSAEQQWREGYDQAQLQVTKALKLIEGDLKGIPQSHINKNWTTGYQAYLEEVRRSL